MNIVNHYTGNPMVNNALMTIKALAGLRDVRDITTDVLRRMITRVCDELPYPLVSLNMRFKSYTMLFTNNGPLYYDKKMGKRIYETLMLKIIDGFETEGDRQCNITGMHYSRTFSDFMLDTLICLGVSEKEARGKDLTFNRCWFPLLGGLGSDAQSLPMAMQTYDVHPVCAVLLQFLPLFAHIYKKGILLVDSTALEFCEEFVEEKVSEIVDKVKEVAASDAPIENIKGALKGNFILDALEVMERCKADCGHADVNLWSFSNFGPGANCSIDRVPNELLRQLSVLRSMHKGELEHILRNPSFSPVFLECLSDRKEWAGLYPAKKYEGVSAEFFESYWTVIGKEKKTDWSKYVSGLVMKYKTRKDDTVLNKSDAYDSADYGPLLNRVLLRATENGDWSMRCQLAVLNDPEQLPIYYSCSEIYKLIHFYYQKNISVSEQPQTDVNNMPAFRFCLKMIHMINNTSDNQKEKIIKRILEFDSSDVFDELLTEKAWKDGIYHLYPLLYTVDGKKNVYGLCSLLRLYYKNVEDVPSFEDGMDFPVMQIPHDIRRWLDNINRFACQYVDCRLHGSIDESKHAALCERIKRSIPRSDIRLQMIWFYSVLQRLSENGSDWNEYDLIYDPSGNYAFSTFLFVFKLKLNEIYSKLIKNQ